MKELASAIKPTRVNVNVLHARCQAALEDIPLMPEQEHDHTPAKGGKEGKGVVGRGNEAVFVGELAQTQHDA